MLHRFVVCLQLVLYLILNVLNCACSTINNTAPNCNLLLIYDELQIDSHNDESYGELSVELVVLIELFQ